MANTPFSSGYLGECIGRSAVTEAAEAILNGTFCPEAPEDLLPETIDILNALGSPLPVQQTSTTSSISLEEFRNTYKIVKETTSSSPSGRHVGHHKAATKDPILMELHSTMMSLPYMVGFPPERWRQVTDIMLEKTPGAPNIHRLMILALMESDYNQANRILFARQLGQRLEDNNIIPTLQYGSQSGKHCFSTVLNKKVTYDIVRQMISTAAFIENDVVGCYDHLVNLLLILQLQCLGASVSPTSSLNQTWLHTWHNIKILYGLLELTYKNTDDIPLFRPGQGSTIGPFLWLLLLCLIAEVLGVSTPIMQFSSVDNTTTLSNPGEAFVDDSFPWCTSSHTYNQDLSFSDNQKYHIYLAMSNLTYLVQRWERLLFTTGGALNLQKSYWHLMAWQWNSGSARLATPTTTSQQLLLTSGQQLSNLVPPP